MFIYHRPDQGGDHFAILHARFHSMERGEPFMTSVAAHPARNRLIFNRLGLWLFFVSEVFMFGGLLVMRFHLWGNTRPDLDQRLGVTVTAILLVSSFFMNRAEIAAAHDDRNNFLVSLVIT